jgi:cytochrome c oxidase cbb3-type subunit III
VGALPVRPRWAMHTLVRILPVNAHSMSVCYHAPHPNQTSDKARALFPTIKATDFQAISDTKTKLLANISFLWTTQFVCMLAVATLLLLFLANSAQAVDNPFAGNPQAAKAGEFQFRINCAFCHGLGAHGGGRGPDLTKARKRHGNSDDDLFRTINNGVPGTAMPPNGTTGQGVGMTDEEIWQVITYLRSVQVKTPAQPIGNATHGKDLFYGDANCSGCHMTEGKGGRLGPDLTSVGTARSVDYIIDSVRNPSRRLAQGLFEATKEFPQEYETVTVVTSDGKEIEGVALNEDQFTLQLMDRGERIYSFQKDQLRDFKKSRASLMPKYDASLLSDKDLQDIVAYLLSLETK